MMHIVRKYTWKLPQDSIHKDGLKASGLAVVTPIDLKVEFTKLY
jgi:cholesterol 24(S)-hydroxylase